MDPPDITLPTRGNIAKEWDKIGLDHPHVYWGNYMNDWFITISDKNTTVFSFMNKKGYKYVAVKSKCKPIKTKDLTYYRISEKGALQIISCPGKFEREFDARELAIYKNIYPIFFPEKQTK